MVKPLRRGMEGSQTGAGRTPSPRRRAFSISVLGIRALGFRL